MCRTIWWDFFRRKNGSLLRTMSGTQASVSRRSRHADAFQSWPAAPDCYISSLVNGIDFTPGKADPAVRARLETELMEQGVGPLYARLQQVDPECAAKLHPNNHGRVLRALELYEQTARRCPAGSRAPVRRSSRTALC